jgi:hypothetical protein
LAYRRGFATISKSFFYEQDRANKLDGAGFKNYDWDFIESKGAERYFVDIVHTHPAATEIGLILTYLAPPYMGTTGTSYDPYLKIRLENSSGTILDPSSGSGYAINLTHGNGGIPTSSVIVGESNYYRTDDGAINLPYSRPIYAARVVRTACYLDQGNNPSTSPRRMKYGTAAGTSQHLIVVIDTLNVVLLNATVFEIPRLTTP